MKRCLHCGKEMAAYRRKFCTLACNLNYYHMRRQRAIQEGKRLKCKSCGKTKTYDKMYYNRKTKRLCYSCFGKKRRENLTWDNASRSYRRERGQSDSQGRMGCD